MAPENEDIPKAIQKMDKLLHNSPNMSTPQEAADAIRQELSEAAIKP